MKKLCHNGNNKYEWKSTRLQLRNYKPMLNTSPPCDCKACFKGTHFQTIKDVHKKMLELLKENTLKGITCTYSNRITETAF